MRRAVTPIDADDVARGKRLRHTLPDVQRDAEAARLRAAGLSYRQVGQRLGVAHTTAVKMEQRALDRVVLPSVHELRQAENYAIDQDMAALQAIVDDPPFVVVPGAGVTTQRNMQVVVQAIDARTRLRARRARMNGMDAPVVSVHKTQTERELDDTIKGLMADLIMRGQLIAGQVESG